MLYTSKYKSPVGNLLIASKDNKLVGLWIENQKYYLSNFKEKIFETENLEILVKTTKWLDRYFSGGTSDINELDINFIGSKFRKSVWEILKNIPYGEIITYNDIAKELARQKGIERMSAQAVGGAVAHNPILIIIPCHRVVGTNGNLTGYAGGIKNKVELLKLEGNDMSKYFIPRQSNVS